MSKTFHANFNKRSPKVNDYRTERHSTRKSLQNLIGCSDTSLINILLGDNRSKFMKVA